MKITNMIYNKPTQCAHYALAYAPHSLHQFFIKNEKKKAKSSFIRSMLLPFNINQIPLWDNCNSRYWNACRNVYLFYFLFLDGCICLAVRWSWQVFLFSFVVFSLRIFFKRGHSFSLFSDRYKERMSSFKFISQWWYHMWRWDEKDSIISFWRTSWK